MEFEDLGHVYLITNFSDIEQTSEEHNIIAMSIEEKLTNSEQKEIVKDWIKIFEKTVRLIQVWRNLQTL